MDGLPAEILQEIVGYLSEEDLDSVRLVNYKLPTAANVFKYRVLRVRITRKGLNHLLYVSQHPELARSTWKILGSALWLWRLLFHEYLISMFFIRVTLVGASEINSMIGVERWPSVEVILSILTGIFFGLVWWINELHGKTKSVSPNTFWIS
ncbi:hypothetical protein RUND412_009788 [Rhizina undulata]